MTYRLKTLKNFLTKTPERLALMIALTRMLNRTTRKFIFAASPGRSGTMTLWKLLEHDSRFSAHQLMFPDVYDEALRSKNNGSSLLAYQTFRRKAMRAYWVARKSEFFLDSSQYFIPGFCHEAAYEFGEKLAVIQLYRDPIDVARSFYSIGSIPGTPHGNTWLYDYHATSNRISIIDALQPGGELDHDFYRVYWYVLEFYARMVEFRRQQSAVPWVMLKTYELSDRDAVSAAFEELGIKNLKFGESEIERANEKKERKANVNRTMDADLAREFEDKLINYLKDRQPELSLYFPLDCEELRQFIRSPEAW